jgi:hypothetical protein
MHMYACTRRICVALCTIATCRQWPASGTSTASIRHVGIGGETKRRRIGSEEAAAAVAVAVVAHLCLLALVRPFRWIMHGEEWSPHMHVNYLTKWLDD